MRSKVYLRKRMLSFFVVLIMIVAIITIIPAESFASLPPTQQIYGGMLGDNAAQYVCANPTGPTALGDVWSSTCADDGYLYIASDDTGGFGAGAGEAYNEFMISKVGGSSVGSLTREQIFTFVEQCNGVDDKVFGSPASGGTAWKQNGITSINGTLYLTIARHRYSGGPTNPLQDAMDSSIIKSTDHGGTWSSIPSLADIPVNNQAFETGTLTGWTQTGTNGVITSGQYDGYQSAKLTSYNNEIRQTVTGLKAGKTYTLKAVLKVDDPNTDTIRLGVRNTSTGGTTPSIDVTSVTWAGGEITFKLGSSATSAEIYIKKQTGNGLGYVDHIRLTGLTNHGFERSDLTGWSKVGGTSATVISDSNVIFEGYSAKITTLNESIEQNVASLEPNTTYDLRVYGKVDSGKTLTIGVKGYGGVEITKTITTTNASETSIVFNTGSDPNAVIYAKKTGATGGAVYVDHFSLTEAMLPGKIFTNPHFIEYEKDGKIWDDGIGDYVLPPDGGDTYVYAIGDNGGWQNVSELRLGRVSRTNLPNLRGSDWQYYDPNSGTWKSDPNQAAPIISDSGKISMASINYIRQLDRYVILEWYYPDPMSTSSSRIVYYESEFPWGPYTKFYEATERGWYNMNFCPKFASSDGLVQCLFTQGDFGNTLYEYGLQAYDFRLITDPNYQPGTINDGSFSTADPLKYWTTTSGTVTTSGSPHSAPKHLKLNGEYDMAWQGISGLKPNTTYELSGYIKSGDPNNGVWFGVKNFGNDEIMETITSTTYVQKKIRFTTGPDIDHAMIYVMNGMGCTIGYADDITIQEIIQNSDFSTGGMDWWSYWNIDSIVEDYAAKLNSSVADECLYQTISGLDPNTIYKATARCKLGNANDVMVMGAADWINVNTTISITDTNYKDYTLVFDSGPTGSVDLYFLLNHTATGSNYAYVDNVKLQLSILENPSFESTLKSWEAVSGDPTWTTFGLDCAYGKNGAIHRPYLGNTCEIRQQIKGLQPGTTYRFKGWARVDNSSDNVTIGIVDGNSATISTTTYSQTSAISFTSDASGNATVYIKLTSNTGGYGYADELIVYK